jgi:hypothetical protein
MVDIYIDSTTHDIDLTNQTMRLTSTSLELIRQRIDITLSMFRGEWFANIDVGVPYIKNDNNNIQILGASDTDVIDYYIRDAVLGVDGVTSIISYTSVTDKQLRTMSINFTVLTDENETLVFDTQL